MVCLNVAHCRLGLRGATRQRCRAMSPPDSDRTELILRSGAYVFGRYTLAEVVGEGGMGVVWRARDEKLERDVALKFLPDRVRRDPEAVRDLKRETKRCLDLTHPNIVRVYDFIEDHLAAAIAMEYVPGQSLSALKAARPGGCFDAADLAPLVRQVCAALDYAHTQAQVVHRDLKPANLLVTAGGVLKVADFGIARSLRETHTRQTGDLRGASGTLAFMGPQQLESKGKPAPSDDLYALGATLYDLLTGKPPFYGADIFTEIRSAAPVPLEERRAELENTGAPIPAEWERTIFACLAKRAEDRPRDASQIAALLAIPDGRGTEIESKALFGESGALVTLVTALPKSQTVQSTLHYPAPGETWPEEPSAKPDSLVKYAASEDGASHLGIWVVVGLLLLALLGYLFSTVSGRRVQPETGPAEHNVKHADARGAAVPASAPPPLVASPPKVEGQTGQSATPLSASASKTTRSVVKEADSRGLEPGLPSSERVTRAPSVNSIPESDDTLRFKGARVFASSKLDERPKPSFQASPKYPPEMHRAGITGQVTVDFIVDSNGDVQNAYALNSSRREFESAAVEAVRAWKFKPGSKDGRNVNTHMQVPIIFSLKK